ncbi:hypothetical protein OAJ72_01805 [Pelagibacteraceae bacterium]|nr:hypothetical protein [Pelagibacteraceae bacterium]
MKKLLGIVVLSLLLIHPVYAGTCKTPKNPKEKFVLAPEPIPYKRKTPTTRIEEVLSKRKTINVFRAWHKGKYDSNKYGLYWDGASIIPPKSFNLGIREIFWHYYSTKSYYHWYEGIDKFAKNKKWKDSTEYKNKIIIDHTHIDYPKFITNLIKENTKTMDGILFDWWHDEHDFAGGFSKSKVKQSRINISKEIRNELGDDFLIIGNTNWRKDSGTHDTINGVFMELNKKNLSSGYSCGQIKNIEGIIKFHDQNLQEPRIIAVNPWRITKVSKELVKKLTIERLGEEYERDLSKSEKKWWINYWKFHYRSSPENIKFAKLFTAMAMVIPENGYILYGDNNPNPNPDHYHDFYDFYNTDLGKATSHGMEITEGLAYKKYEKGLIAYNRTKFKYIIKFKDGKKIEIGPLEGVFVKD